jgi:hypothetical protein
MTNLETTYRNGFVAVLAMTLVAIQFLQRA